MAEIDLKQLTHCALCPNMCRFDCPTLRAEKNEAVAPSFKARLMYLITQGHIEPDAQAADIAYHCVGCDGCRTWCEFPEVDLSEWVRKWRADLVAERLAPETVQRLIQTLRSHGRAFGETGEDLCRGSAQAVGESGGILYYAGCTAARWRPQTLRATFAVFESAGVSYRTLSDEPCCGFAALAVGDTGLSLELARRTADAVRRSGAQVLVTGCPECYEMFTARYPGLGLDLDIEILHSTEFFARLLEEGRLRLKEHAETMVVHDPCVLGRKLEKYDALRAVLTRVPGLEVRELRHNRREARCCGGGDMMADINPRLSGAIAAEKAGELSACGVSRAVTACPNCERSLNEAGRIEVLDVADLLAERLTANN